ncbi:MAG: Ni/Fe-hydrogenase cytochrome b subunit [Acidobacteria bacterium]|nr:Ni/Fe-hydrogenase cytochrome b subunit [Acidobacteriota bacterium]MBI3663619.1 Ni/Fe-hydrogenase cytochrome b subunit [Acidobacteriota bacterium]
MKPEILKPTFWKTVFLVVVVLGLYAAIVRFVQGLGASTNLSDEFPWGLWIGFDVLCGVMLAAGGFTLTACVYLFNLERFRPIVRPTVLTAFLGYALVVVALLFDLGRSYRIWHPLVMWNPRSVMFEVAWCVMLYTTVLSLEFAPVVFERLRMERPRKILRGISIPLVLAGVMLSTLHQSSLGSLYLIVPHKLHPFWYTPLLPVFFFLSAIAIGLAMTIFESSLTAKHLRKHLELPLLQELGRVLLVVLLVYSVLRVQDLYHRGALKLVLQPGYETQLFLLEVLMGLVAPIVLLLFPRVRRSANGLYLSAVLAILGFITNRLNVSITGMEASAGVHYLPKWTELAITASIIAVGFAIFGLAAKHLPIFPDQSWHAPSPRATIRELESPEKESEAVTAERT